jgi:hypothetical protein
MRASLVVNRQWTWRSSALVAWVQAVSSSLRSSRSAMRRPRVGPVVGAGVDAQHILHRGCERRVGVRRDRPACFQVRLKRPLFRTRPIVEWSIGGIPSVRATCLSNSRSVHR